MQTWIWRNTTRGMTYDCLIWNSPYSNTTPSYFKFRVKILKMIGFLELAISQDLLYLWLLFPWKTVNINIISLGGILKRILSLIPGGLFTSLYSWHYCCMMYRILNFNFNDRVPIMRWIVWYWFWLFVSSLADPASDCNDSLTDTNISSCFFKQVKKNTVQLLTAVKEKKEVSFCDSAGAPNVNFRKISVRKTIGDLEFSEHLL